MAQKLAATLTPATFDEVAAAMRATWPDGTPSVDQLAIALGQWGLESGFGRAMHAYNLENAKSSEGDGYDYCYYQCGEEISATEWASIQKDPTRFVTVVRTYTTNGIAMVSVLAHPDDPMCRFRAFKSLEDGARDYLALLKKRYPEAWAAMAKGDVTEFAKGLKARYFFTDALDHYLNGPPGSGLGLQGTVAEVRRKLGASAPSPSVTPPAEPTIFDLFPFEDDESVPNRLARFVRSANGISLKNKPGVLRALVGRGVDEPSWAAQVVLWSTNCGTTALGFIVALCGSVAAARAIWPTLAARSVNGKSVSWIMEFGRVFGAWVLSYGKPDVAPEKGDLIHYRSVPYRVNALGDTIYDDHVEWCLGDGDHGGGGRSGNLVEVGHSDWRWSAGRPAYQILRCSKIPFPKSPPKKLELPQAVKPADMIPDPTPVPDGPVMAPESGPAKIHPAAPAIVAIVALILAIAGSAASSCGKRAPIGPDVAAPMMGDAGGE